MIQGTCLCGTLRYEIDGPLTSMMNCHCSMCRKQHGAAFATYAVAPASGFRWIAGEDQVVRYQSSAQGSRAFCRHCGSVAPGAFPAMGIVFAPAGNLAGELGRHPEGHMFVGSKAPWHAITGKPSGEPRSRYCIRRPSRRVIYASTTEAVSGSAGNAED